MKQTRMMFVKLLVTVLVLWMNLSLSIGEDSANDEGNNSDETTEQSTNTDYEEVLVVRWRIENPPIVEYDNLRLNIKFAVSDYVQANKHVRYDVYLNPECGNPDDIITDADGYMETSVSEDNTPLGPGIDERIKKIVTVSSKLNPGTIIKSESYQENGNTATITYCVLFSLWSGEGPSDPFVSKVSQLAVTTGLTLDLDDNFRITAKNIEAKGKNVQIAEDQFFVEAFFCDETGKPPTLVSPLVQGRVVRVCVRPTNQASEVGFRMQSIDKFTYVQGLTSQVAISNGGPAENGLTELFCQQGARQCFFETFLFSYFYLNNAQGVQEAVIGNGVATLQWGGEGVDRRLEPLNQTLASVEKDAEEESINEKEEEKNYARALADRSSQRTIGIPAFAILADDGRERPPLRAKPQVKNRTPGLIALLLTFCVALLVPPIYVYQSEQRYREQDSDEEEDELQKEGELEQDYQNHTETISLPSLEEGETSSVVVDEEEGADEEANVPEEKSKDHRWKLSIIPEDRTIISSARSIFTRRAATGTSQA
mmetsp:Transcript_18781/g.52475  ORF Transcript_18781/g.52475 Transcript_18781/m.52475 type:complete len:540 (+) Transcript_18781:380-1999(+)